MDIEILHEIGLIIEEPSFYEDLKRKSIADRIDDNIKWYEEYGVVNKHYNEFGLDIENFRNQDDYLEDKVIITKRRSIHHEDVDPLLNRVIADNKFFFYAYLENVLPGYSPKLRIVFQGNELFYPILDYANTSLAFNSLNEGKYILKTTLGMKGSNIYTLEKVKDKLLLNNKEIQLDELLELTKEERYLLQDFVYQHEGFGKFSPSSVNTIRIETLRFNEEVNVFYAFARFAAKDGVAYDNASQGGTFVGINLDTGTLREYGEYINIPNQRELRHPLSKLEYKGYQIPFWQEVVELVTKAHPLFYELASIGWDIAITKQGPIIIEINSKPLGKMSQIANGGLKKRYNELVER